jgi:hypothetical protein
MLLLLNNNDCYWRYPSWSRSERQSSLELQVLLRKLMQRQRTQVPEEEEVCQQAPYLALLEDQV